MHFITTLSESDETRNLSFALNLLDVCDILHIIISRNKEDEMQRRLIILAVLAIAFIGPACKPKSKDELSKNIQAVVEVEGRGKMRIQLFPEQAPRAVKQFVKLSKETFYNNRQVWRVGQMGEGKEFVMTGCPKNNGNGYYTIKGKGYFIREDIDSTLHHERGTVSMINFGKPQTTSSQFIICRGQIPEFDGKYSIIGKVTDGLNVLDSLEKGDNILSVTIEEGAE